MELSKQTWLQFCLVLIFILSGAIAGEPPLDFREALQKAYPSVVGVESTVFHPGRPDKSCVVRNTGFFVSQEGHVLTNLLAVSGARKIEVVSSEKRFPARLMAFDQKAGLALLKTGAKQTAGLSEMSNDPEKGDWVARVVATGEPGRNVHVGVGAAQIASTSGGLNLHGVKWENLIVLSGPNFSGGATAPVLDRNGKLLGVVWANSTGETGAERCYVLGGEPLNEIVGRLRRAESRRLGWIGISVTWKKNMEGLSVQGVLHGAPAYTCGLRPGDVLLEIGGKTITGPEAFTRQIAQSPPGTQLSVRFLRGKKVETCRVKLKERPFLISSVKMDQDAPSGLSAPPSRNQIEIIRRLQVQSELLRRRVHRLEKEVRDLNRKRGE
ncbi:MAG: S1C family serine protease [Candidatus Brocadiia bacterium]